MVILEAIFIPRTQRIHYQIEGRETLGLAISLPNDQEDNIEQESTYSEQPVHKTVTMPATSYSDQDDQRAEADILNYPVIATKDKCDIKDSREYCQHHYISTNSLDVKFSVGKYFVPTICEGKPDSGNTHYKKIKEIFCGNTDKINVLKKHCDKYDMNDIIMIPTIINYSSYNP